MNRALIIILTAGLGDLQVRAQSDFNTLVAGLRATVAATDLGRRNPSRVDELVTDYYNQAVQIRKEQNEVIPLTLYLSIEERLAEEGVGPGLSKDLVSAIVNRSAQIRGNLTNFSWSDVRPVLDDVREYIGKISDRQRAVNAILKAPRMLHAANWVKNYSDSVQTPSEKWEKAYQDLRNYANEFPAVTPPVVVATPMPTPIATPTPVPVKLLKPEKTEFTWDKWTIKITALDFVASVPSHFSRGDAKTPNPDSEFIRLNMLVTNSSHKGKGFVPQNALTIRIGENAFDAEDIELDSKAMYVSNIEPTVTRERDCYFEIPKAVIGNALTLHFEEGWSEKVDLHVSIE